MVILHGISYVAETDIIRSNDLLCPDDLWATWTGR